MDSLYKYILIDDNARDLFAGECAIRKNCSAVDIKAFQTAQDGFSHIYKEYTGHKKDIETILFLDVSSSLGTAVKFLADFESLDSAIKKQFLIHIISSAPEGMDKTIFAKHIRDKNISGCLHKPISKEGLEILFQNKAMKINNYFR